MDDTQGSDELIEIIELHEEDDVCNDEVDLNTSDKEIISWNDLELTLSTKTNETKSSITADTGACVKRDSLKPTISVTSKDLFRRNSSGYLSANSSLSSTRSKAPRCNILKRKSLSLLKTNIQRNLLMSKNSDQSNEESDKSDMEIKRKKFTEYGETSEIIVQKEKSDKYDTSRSSYPDGNILRRSLEEPRETFPSAVSNNPEIQSRSFTGIQDKYAELNENNNGQGDQKIENKVNKNSSGFTKPECSYSSLIVLALKNGRHDYLHVNEIYDFICEHFPYYRDAPLGWKNSIRHNLSLSSYFKKIEDETLARVKKKFLWGFNPLKYKKINSELEKRFRGNQTFFQSSMSKPECLEDLIDGKMKPDEKNENSDVPLENIHETLSSSSEKNAESEEDNSRNCTTGEPTSSSFEKNSTKLKSIEIESSDGYDTEDEITSIYKQIERELEDEEQEHRSRSSLQSANSLESLKDQNLHVFLGMGSNDVEEKDLPQRSGSKISYLESSKTVTLKTLRTYGKNTTS